MTSSKLKDQAKKITDDQSIVVCYKDTVTGIERTITDTTSSIRNDADMAILSRINKRKRKIKNKLKKHKCVLFV